MTIRDRYPDMEKPARFDSGRLQVEEIKMFPALVSEAKAAPDLLGYLRTGGCTAGCGACCEAFVIPLDPDAIEAVDFEHVKAGRVQVPVDPTVIGKATTEDWEYWLRLHDTTIFQLPSGVLTADLPVEVKEGPGKVTVDEWLVWLEKQNNIAVLRREGQQVLAYITRKCDELSEDGLCQVFDTPRRPQLCSGYPEHPMDVQGINFCTYNFAPVSRNEVIARNLVGMGRGQPKPPKKKGKRKKTGKKRR